MERVRAISPVSSEEGLPLEEVASLAPVAKMLPLREWVETVGSPGVTREDVESLLAGLSGPLAEGETARERADQLLRLLQDEALGELTGGDGTQVRPAALEALMGLGYPYALEVPPEVLARMRGSTARPLSRSTWWGLGLAALAALMPLIYDPLKWWRHVDDMSILGGVMLLPAVLSAVAERYRLRWLKYLGNVPLVLMSAAGLIPGVIMNLDGWTWRGVTVLGAGLALLASAICLRDRGDLSD